MGASNTDESEKLAIVYLQKRYAERLVDGKFTSIILEDGVWTLTGRIELKSGLMSIAKRDVIVRIEQATENVIGFTEQEPIKRQNSTG